MLSLHLVEVLDSLCFVKIDIFIVELNKIAISIQDNGVKAKRTAKRHILVKNNRQYWRLIKLTAIGRVVAQKVKELEELLEKAS